MGQLALVCSEPSIANNHDPFHWYLRVHITPGSLPAYRAWHPGAVMPEGTTIVAEHLGKRDHTPGPYYFANKAAAGWQFGSATAEGALMTPDPACSHCHAEATSDFVFGLGQRATSTSPIDQRPDGG